MPGTERRLVPGTGARIEIAVSLAQQRGRPDRIVDTIDVQGAGIGMPDPHHAQALVRTKWRAAPAVVFAIGQTDRNEGQQRLLANLQQEALHHLLARINVEQAGACLFDIEGDDAPRHLEEIADPVMNALAEGIGKRLRKLPGRLLRIEIGKPAADRNDRQQDQQQGAEQKGAQTDPALARQIPGGCLPRCRLQSRGKQQLPPPGEQPEDGNEREQEADAANQPGTQDIAFATRFGHGRQVPLPARQAQIDGNMRLFEQAGIAVENLALRPGTVAPAHGNDKGHGRACQPGIGQQSGEIDGRRYDPGKLARLAIGTRRKQRGSRHQTRATALHQIDRPGHDRFPCLDAALQAGHDVRTIGVIHAHHGLVSLHRENENDVQLVRQGDVDQTRMRCQQASGDGIKCRLIDRQVRRQGRCKVVIDLQDGAQIPFQAQCGAAQLGFDPLHFRLLAQLVIVALTREGQQASQHDDGKHLQPGRHSKAVLRCQSARSGICRRLKNSSRYQA